MATYGTRPTTLQTARYPTAIPTRDPRERSKRGAIEGSIIAAIISDHPTVKPRNPIGGSYVTSATQATADAATRAATAMIVVRSTATGLGPRGSSICS